MTGCSRSTALALILTLGGVAGLAYRGAALRAATPIPAGFVEGTPDLKSAGALAFGRDNVLFVGDSRGGAVFALSVDDKVADAHKGDVDIKGIDASIGKALGIATDQVVIRDMAIHPVTHHAYFSVSRGRGADAAPALVRSTLTGAITEIPLASARFAKLALTDAPAMDAKTSWGASSRGMTITDLAFVDGELLIAGLSNEQFSSTLRRATFPFSGAARTTSLEIFHTSHGRYETAAPIETFLPYTVKGQRALLAGYGCAPLAVFDMAALSSGKHVRGRTLAELGGGNRPNDMVAIERDGQRFVIISNSDRTVMRMRGTEIDRSEPVVTAASREKPVIGTPYDSMAIVGVMQLELLNPDFIIMLQRNIETGTLDLTTFPTKYL